MRKRFFFFLAFLIVPILFSFVSLAKALADTYYVDGSVGTTGDGSEGSPWKTIQEAADSVSAGDTVNVKGGITYSGANSCYSSTSTVCLTQSGTSGNYITYKSWSGTGTPIIEGPIDGRGFSVNDSTGVNYNKIIGFIIKNTTYGIYFTGADNHVLNNIIYDTTSSTSSYGIFSTTVDSDIDVFNNTVFQKGTGIHVNMGTATFKNNIVISSGTYGISVRIDYQVTPTIDYNNVYNSGSKDYAVGLLQRGGHDLSQDPQFEDQDNYDFRLKSISPLVDAGTILGDVAIDILDISRPQGNAYDMGAYESSYSQASPPNATPIITLSPTNVLTRLAFFTGEGTNTHFANRSMYKPLDVADINEDGYDDIILSGRHYDPGGGIYVFFGKATPTDTRADSADIIIRSIEPSIFGSTLSAGDIDNDGHLELIVGDYNYSSPQSYNGGAFIFKTSAGFDSRDASDKEAIITGTVSNTKTGSPIKIIGDINGDGYEDILYNGLNYGANADKNIYLFYGSASLIDKTISDADIIFSTDGNCANEPTFVNAVDLNNDSYKDIIIGCRWANSLLGRIYIFYGSDSLSSKSIEEADVFISGAGSDYGFAYNIRTSDINHDGYLDVISKDENNTVYLFYGSSSWTNKTTAEADVVFTPDPAYPEAYYFYHGGVESIDVNNDGYPDIITANPILARVYIFYGGSSLSNKDASQANLIYDGSWGDYTGVIFASGDIDSDGYLDIVASAHRYNNIQGAAHLLTPPHGSPLISLNSFSYSNDATPNITGTVTDSEGVNIDGIQWSLNNTLPGNWEECTATDASFNSSSESFSCNIHGSDLDEGGHTVYFRTYNEYGVYTPTESYGSSSFTIDTTSPTSFSLDSPADKTHTNNERLTFKWKAESSDVRSGLSKYKLEIDNEDTGDFTIDDIPVSRTEDYETNRYVIHYENFGDSDDSNNYISVYTKSSPEWSSSENDGKLKEGKITWKVKAVDGAGNEKEESRTLYVDFTAPSIPALTKLGSLSFDSSQNNWYYTGTKPTFKGTAEADSTVTIIIESDTIQGTVTADSSESWQYKPEKNLETGTHKVSIKTTDKAGNESSALSFSLTIDPTASLFPKKLITQIIEEEKILTETEEEKEKIKEQGYAVKVKVVDKDKGPVKNAKVELHSDPKIAYTNDQGVATFTGVEKGKHTIKIAYQGYLGEQKVKLEGEDVKEFYFTIRVVPNKFSFSPLAIIIIATLFLIISFLIFKPFKNKTSILYPLIKLTEKLKKIKLNL